MGSQISESTLGEMFGALMTGREGPSTLEEGYLLAIAIAQAKQTELMERMVIAQERQAAALERIALASAIGEPMEDGTPRNYLRVYRLLE